MIVSTIGGAVLGFLVAGPMWGLIGGVIALAASLLFGRTYEPVTASDPPIAHDINNTTRFAPMWLALRLIIGYEWLEAGWHKFQDPTWWSTGSALKSYWDRAVAVPAPPARPAITYEWWRGFLQVLNDAQAYTWFGKVITLGELAVGLGMIVGAFVGLAAAGGILMNMSFLLSGSTSSNPVLLFLQIGMILAWKVAGWIGLDRWLLPMLGTLWGPGYLFKREGGSTPPPTPSPQLR